MGIFLELLGKCVLPVTVALLMKCESEAAGGHLVTTWDTCLESAMPEAKDLLTCWFPESVPSMFFSRLSQFEWHFSALRPEESCLPQLSETSLNLQL